MTYPDSEIAWRDYAIPAAEEVIRSEGVHCLISVWPIPAHLIARTLKERYRIPWVADFPDLWSETYSYRYGSIRKWFDRRLEKSVLRQADRLSTSSGPLSDIMRELHRRSDVETILMGYDPERINEPPVPVTSKFTITYTGIFYGADRNPSKFLAGLRAFLMRQTVDRNDVEVRFYGPHVAVVEEEIRRSGLSDVVEFLGTVSWDECLQRQRESQILLQLNWENPKEKGAYSGKIAEYLAARRPVLSVGGSSGDVMESLIAKTRCGLYCLTAEETAHALHECYLEFKQYGRTLFRGDLGGIERYSYREMARSFASVLDDLCNV